MQITDVSAKAFTYVSNTVRDSEGHGHPGPEHEATQTLVRVATDDGAEGYAFGADPRTVENVFKPAMLGENPLYREKIWRTLHEWMRLHGGRVTDRTLAVADMALWDLAGRMFEQPVHRLLGAYRDKVPAYASTMCGDDLPGGLDSPQAYADYAEWCVQRGYPAYKLHTWQPPVPGAPSVKRDLEACRAVRERVGPDIDLMLDPYHYYSRQEAKELAVGLHELGYAWMEEPMDEHSMSSYVWLTREVDLPICGPETAKGSIQTRAEWIRHDAADIIRTGVGDVGGITPCMKIIHMCEAFGLSVEIHGGGAGNLHVLGAMPIRGQYYERGLLHPFIDHDQPPAWLHEPLDRMDEEGYVHIPDRPGLGMSIDFDYIDAHAV